MDNESEESTKYQEKMMLKRIAVLLLVVFALVACEGVFEDDGPQYEPVPSGDFKRIEVTLRDHGYHNLSDTVIRSASGLERYIDSIRNQNYWNHKEEFIAALENEDLDFEKYNMVFYFHTEGSGSITLLPEPPYWKNVDKTKVLIRLWRHVPETQTTDMAYYAFAYKAKKEIEEVFIWINDMDPVTIEN